MIPGSKERLMLFGIPSIIPVVEARVTRISCEGDICRVEM